ncbi:MAG TPA: hypothetical protein VN043_12970 [Rhodanobacter sp.]|nr:hypothetical protein [Rhodanobacter sp.]
MTNRIVRLAAWLLLGWGAFVLLALPTHRYAWLQQMDPSITLPPDANADSRTIFVLLVLAAVVVGQVAIMATAKTRNERIIAVVIVVAAIAPWASRQGC